MNDRRAQLEDALRSIPDGVCSIQILETGLPPIRSVTVRTEGKGCMTAATIFPGIELSYWQILAPTVSFRMKRCTTPSKSPSAATAGPAGT